MNIKGKIIIVTGASEGIGRATSKLLTDQGAQVVLVACSIDKLKQLEKELPGSFAVAADLRKGADVKRVVEATVQKFARVDILINNAGQGMWIPVDKIDIEKYRMIIELNLIGALRAMQAVIPVMRKQGGGMILNVSSMVTKAYFPNLAAYASTKYALNCLTFTARQELEKDKIIVSAILPKLVNTNFGKHALEPEPDSLRDPNNTNAPPMDEPETVADKILELIRSEEAELQL